MARNTLSREGSGKAGEQTSPGANSSIKLLLAGLTGLVIGAIAALAVLSTTGGGGGTQGFTPNDEGLIPVGEKAPGFTAEAVGGGSVWVCEGDKVTATMLIFFAT